MKIGQRQDGKTKALDTNEAETPADQLTSHASRN